MDIRVQQGLGLTFFALLAACTGPASAPGLGSGFGSGSGLKAAPDEVAALAAPNQNLAAVRLDPEDGCYWYLYDGPVETTLLPLRSKRGRRICLSAQVSDAPES